MLVVLSFDKLTNRQTFLDSMGLIYQGKKSRKPSALCAMKIVLELCPSPKFSCNIAGHDVFELTYLEPAHM